MSYFVYILRTSSNTLYIGQTNNLEKRLKEHQNKSRKSAKYIRYFSSFDLVNSEKYTTREAVMKREWQLKKWSRKKKELLIRRAIVPSVVEGDKSNAKRSPTQKMAKSEKGSYNCRKFISMGTKEIKSSLDGMYQLLSEGYKGNWQYRWQDTPYLEEAVKSGKVESVVGHEWGTMEFWFHLRRLCPKLDSLVDTTKVYEILLNHDLGETNEGDIPLYRKINGAKDNKESERDGLKQITDSLPETQNELLAWFDEFEQEVGKIDRLEMLIAKWMDNLQGNHFALTFGKDLPHYSEPINNNLQIRFVAYTNRLLDVLEGRNEAEAMDEVRQVALHHANVIKAAGINFDTSRLKI